MTAACKQWISACELQGNVQSTATDAQCTLTLTGSCFLVFKNASTACHAHLMGFNAVLWSYRDLRGHAMFGSQPDICLKHCSVLCTPPSCDHSWYAQEM